MARTEPTVARRPKVWTARAGMTRPAMAATLMTRTMPKETPTSERDAAKTAVPAKPAAPTPLRKKATT